MYYSIIFNNCFLKVRTQKNVRKSTQKKPRCSENTNVFDFWLFFVLICVRFCDDFEKHWKIHDGARHRVLFNVFKKLDEVRSTEFASDPDEVRSTEFACDPDERAARTSSLMFFLSPASSGGVVIYSSKLLNSFWRHSHWTTPNFLATWARIRRFYIE